MVFGLITGTCGELFASDPIARIVVSSNTGRAGIMAALSRSREMRLSNPNLQVIIELPAQVELTEPITLGADDSGASSRPLIIRGTPQVGTSISGAIGLPVQLSAIKEAGREIVRAPLEPLENTARRLTPAFSDLDYLTQSRPGRLFVFSGNTRLLPARLPADGYFRHPEILSQDSASITIAHPRGAPSLHGQSGLWVAGYWGHNWMFEARQVLRTTPATVTFARPRSRVTESSRFFFFNVPWITKLGSFHFDVSRREILAHLSCKDRRNIALCDGLEVAVAESLLTIKGAQNVRIENIRFEKSIGTAILIEGSSNIIVKDCVITQTGGEGVLVERSEYSGIDGCLLRDIGLTGAILSGGDRRSLQPGGNFVRNSRITRFGQVLPAYRPGVLIRGVGQIIEGVEIAESDHAGIIFSGNDHLIKGNVFRDLVLDTDDAGAIYGGGDWSAQGTTIEHNYFHDIRNRISRGSVVGVYLDDQLSGINVRYNVFDGVDRPIALGGGRDNSVTMNLSVNSNGHGQFWADSRGLGWQAKDVGPGGIFRTALESVPFRSEAYRARFPGLSRILEEEPGAPVRVTIADNIADKEPIVLTDGDRTLRYVKIERNVVVAAARLQFPDELQGVAPGIPAVEHLKKTIKMTSEVFRRLEQLPLH